MPSENLNSSLATTGKLYFCVHTGKQDHVEFMAGSRGQHPTCSQFRAELGPTDLSESVFLELLSGESSLNATPMS